MVPVYLIAPVCHKCETKAAKCNVAINDFIG